MIETKRSPNEMDLLWNRYIKTRDIALRNILVEEYLPLVKYPSGRFFFQLSQNVDKTDLYQNGVMGLIQAVERFDPSQKIQFLTFASFRVRGQMIDSVRKDDFLSSSLRKMEKDYFRISEELEDLHGRQPTNQEIAEKMNVSLKQLEKQFLNFLWE